MEAVTTIYDGHKGRIRLNEHIAHSEEWDKYYLHRIGGPAVIVHFKDGVVGKAWFVNNKCHREDGPARIWYNPDGEIFRKEHFVDGKQISKKELFKYKLAKL